MVKRSSVEMRLFLVMFVASAIAAFSVIGCSSGSSGEEVSIDFAQGPQGGTAGFADYPVGQEAFFELTADYRTLPAPLESMGGALYSSGNNHSDDLFMFLRRQVAGLQPDQDYRVSARVRLASQYHTAGKERISHQAARNTSTGAALTAPRAATKPLAQTTNTPAPTPAIHSHGLNS